MRVHDGKANDNEKHTLVNLETNIIYNIIKNKRLEDETERDREIKRYTDTERDRDKQRTETEK